MLLNLMRASAAVAAAVLAPAAALAQPRALQVNLPQGSELRFDERVSMQMDMQMSMAGNDINMNGNVIDTVGGTVSVLESSGGRPTRVQVAFDPGLTTQMDMGGMNQSTPFALAGQTVTVTLGPGGAVQTVEPMITDDAAGERLEGVLKFGRGLLPAQPVSVGDTWQPTDASLFGDEMQMGGGSQIELVGFGQADGREVAELRVTGDLTGLTQGMQTTGQVGGTVQVDTATGTVVSGNINGDLKMAGEQVGGQDASVNGTMQVTATLSGAVSAGGNGGNAGGAAPAASGSFGFGSGGGGTAAPAQPAPPAGGEGDAGAFAGTWTDGELTLNVGAGGPDAVQIVRGGNTFNGQIQSATATGFSGTFTAGGNSFPFSGQQTPAGIDFTSGQKTYRLTREGGGEANPLD